MAAVHSPTRSSAHPAQLRRVFVTGGSGFIGRALLAELARRGVTTIALARSPEAEAKVVARGAQPCRSDLHDLGTLEAGMRGCSVVIHAGSYLPDWDYRLAYRENVIGSRNVVTAAKRAGVRRIVYVSGIGVMLGSGPVRNADEYHSRGRGVGVLSATRVLSDREMNAANDVDLETVIVRFPYVWGPGNTFLPALRAGVKAGRFRWINGGRHLISTVHIANAVEALILAAERGRPGGIYWVTDGPPVEQRSFLETHLRAAGIAPPTAEISFAAARLTASIAVFLARLMGRSKPPALTPTTVHFLGLEITVDDSAARRELGYVPRVTWPDGPM